MWEVILKMWFLLVILPFCMIEDGYYRLEKFINENNYHPDWVHVLLAILGILLTIVMLLQYGYR